MSIHLKAARHPRALLAGACPALVALALVGCGQTVSTSGFKGEQHEVAQALSSLQSNVNTADQGKVCSNELASSVVARLNAAKGGCKSTIKDALGQIDNTNLTVDSVTLGGSTAKPTASAAVRTIFSGKTRRSTVSLVKEEGKWKIAAVR
jgi:hypothetical protein